MNAALVCGAGPPRNGKGASPAPIPKLHLNSPQSKTGEASAQQVCSHSVTRTEQMLRQIQTLRAMQAPFGFVFWFLEQKISRLTDEIERP
jgi:hypothetical protein